MSWTTEDGDIVRLDPMIRRLKQLKLEHIRSGIHHAQSSPRTWSTYESIILSLDLSLGLSRLAMTD